MSTALCTLTVRFLCGFAVKALSVAFCASKGPMGPQPLSRTTTYDIAIWLQYKVGGTSFWGPYQDPTIWVLY